MPWFGKVVGSGDVNSKVIRERQLHFLKRGW